MKYATSRVMARTSRGRDFCYNKKVKGAIFFLGLVFCLASGMVYSEPRGAETVGEFVLRLERTLDGRAFSDYLEAFSPEIREKEQAEIDRYFHESRTDSVRLLLADRVKENPSGSGVFLQAIFQNPHRMRIETWQIRLEEREGRWVIVEKTVMEGGSDLYKIRLPGERVELAERVEITHADIRLSFRHALVFYDNIPELETALLVLGEGRVLFAPSDPIETHQLEILYKTRRLDDAIDHAFLRFSDSFFRRNVRVMNASSAPVSLVEASRIKADSIFAKHLPRFFAVENPWSEDILSFLPQGDESVIEFRGRKVGDLSYIFSAFADEEITLYDQAKNRFVNLYSPRSEDGRKRMVISLGRAFDVKDYAIDLDFIPQNHFLSVKAKIGLVSQAARLTMAKLKFHPDLEILHIYDREKRDLFFSRDRASRTLYVHFLEPVPEGERADLEFIYRGRLIPPVQIADTVAGGQYQERYPLADVSYQTFLFSQAASWYPAPVAEDYFTARLNIIVPPQYSVISNGRLLDRGVLDGLQRVTEIDKIGHSFFIFETKTPVKYLSFLVGKLSLVQETAHPVPMAHFHSADLRWPKKGLLEDARAVVEFYERRFGPFPFESLGFVNRLWETSGGHSPASFVVLNDVPKSPDDPLILSPKNNPVSPVDLSQWREYFLAHEIAHQWWGQGVTWARYRDHWLSEGMAQYASALYLRERYGQDAFSKILKKFSRWTEQKSSWGPIILGSRLSFINFAAYQAIIYNKAALVLNMLSDMLGEDVFFQGLRQFFNRHKFGPAATGQFRRAMEEVSGRTLADFFSAWFESHLLPDVRCRYRVDFRPGESVLKLRVDQVNGVFSFPLWIEWQSGDGGSGREKILIERETQDFELVLPAQPKRIKVNPDGAVPGRFRTRAE